MLVDFDDQTFDFNLEEIDLMQALKIKAVCGLTLIGLENGLEDGDPDALRAVYWLMLQNTGLKTPLEGINFKIVKFAQAMSAATERDRKEREAKEKEEVKAKRDARKNPTT